MFSEGLFLKVIKVRDRLAKGYNSLPNDKNLDLTKLKAFADDKINVTQTICFGKGIKHCWKRRKCCLPAFSPFPTMFSKLYSFRVF